MRQRPALRRAIAQLIVLWLATTAGLGVVFLVYAAATDEPVRAHPTSYRRSA
ncbi:hypothetical protein [Cupriavidus sp. D384]|uniref:hypothetical protein n=1 Tax=Cupriavidus sp. D384 TaxID=1538095 RepID=UPI0012E74282|nr:hypothetical protein [Cupriavidus sp. D384]